MAHAVFVFMKLASFCQRWYIIEKFDDTTVKYQVTKCVHQNEFSRYVKKWEKQYGQSYEEKVASYHDEIDNLYREADKYGEKRSDFNDDVLKQSGESEKILGLGEDENRKQQGEFNSGRSGSSSNKDISRFGAARLTDDPKPIFSTPCIITRRHNVYS